VVNVVSTISRARARRHAEGLDLVVPICGSETRIENPLLSQVVQIGIDVQGSAPEIPVRVYGDASVSKQADGRNLVSMCAEIIQLLSGKEALLPARIVVVFVDTNLIAIAVPPDLRGYGQGRNAQDSKKQAQG